MHAALSLGPADPIRHSRWPWRPLPRSGGQAVAAVRLRSRRHAASCALAPFLDLVLTWNTGISYGLFPQEGPFGQWVLLALKAIAVVLLWIWLARTTSRLTALSLGLIIGGAIGNAIDRLAYGAVVDFVLFHVTTASFNFNWYVFNLADVAIVAGVIGLLYETLSATAPQKRPDPGHNSARGDGAFCRHLQGDSHAEPTSEEAAAHRRGRSRRAGHGAGVRAPAAHTPRTPTMKTSRSTPRLLHQFMKDLGLQTRRRRNDRIPRARAAGGAAQPQSAAAAQTKPRSPRKPGLAEGSGRRRAARQELAAEKARLKGEPVRGRANAGAAARRARQARRWQQEERRREERRLQGPRCQRRRGLASADALRARHQDREDIRFDHGRRLLPRSRKQRRSPASRRGQA